MYVNQETLHQTSWNNYKRQSALHVWRKREVCKGFRPVKYSVRLWPIPKDLSAFTFPRSCFSSFQALSVLVNFWGCISTRFTVWSPNLYVLAILLIFAYVLYCQCLACFVQSVWCSDKLQVHFIYYYPYIFWTCIDSGIVQRDCEK